VGSAGRGQQFKRPDSGGGAGLLPPISGRFHYIFEPHPGKSFALTAAFGVPAVGSRSGGIPDAVVDGGTGILVPEESPDDPADALTFFYREPATRREMGIAARERAMRQFSPKVIAARFREEASIAVRR
jgi:glycosyltransferase involved in cell wall biosynthesis